MKTEFFEDEPKLLGNSAARQARQSELKAPHVQRLTFFVENLRTQMGPDYQIPYFDPWDGGINAEVLFLLEAAGPKAVESGFISRNNPDETAKNFFLLSQEAGITRKRSIVWNIVPWYIGSGVKIRPAHREDIAEGMQSLGDLLKLLEHLKAIVLVGKKAQRGERLVAHLHPHIKVFNSLHPSPLCINSSPQNREKILSAWREVAGHIS